MMNELLWFGFAILNFLLFIGMYKLFGKTGIFVWIAIGTILANIQVTKSITVFGLHATLGNIMYGTIFLATDALNELYDKKTATKAVMLGFIVLCITLIVMQVALVFQPNSEDIAQDSLETIFGFLPRIALGSLVAFLISQFFDVNLFQKIKSKLPNDKYLWLRNNGSTFVSQLIDSLIFVPIAFLGIYSFPVVLQIFVSTYLIKVFVALLDTPFLYLIKKVNPLE
ncbi:MAG: queuosine precursor transporter [Candidatus Izemoplasmatales bacterium]|nr:queuosine precursor transporter [Candidatus Izemoplasmatales bacterium]